MFGSVQSVAGLPMKGSGQHRTISVSVDAWYWTTRSFWFRRDTMNKKLRQHKELEATILQVLGELERKKPEEIYTSTVANMKGLKPQFTEEEVRQALATMRELGWM